MIEAEGGPIILDLIIFDYKTDSVTEATVDEKVASHELKGRRTHWLSKPPPV